MIRALILAIVLGHSAGAQAQTTAPQPAGTAQTAAPAKPISVRPGIAITPEYLKAMIEQKAAGGPALPPGMPDGPTAANEDKNPRLTALLQLHFDRRSATILKQWSASLLPETVESTSKPTENTPTAPTVPLTDEQKKKQQEANLIQEETKNFGQWVTLGNWSEVRKYLADLPKSDARKVYEHLLDGLGAPPSAQVEVGGPSMQVAGGMGAFSVVLPGGGRVTRTRFVSPTGEPGGAFGQAQRVNVLTTDDLAGIIESAPCPFNRARIQKLAALFSLVTQAGHLLDPLAVKLEQGLADLGGPSSRGREKAARLFLQANQLELCKRFLPEISNRSDASAVDRPEDEASDRSNPAEITEDVDRLELLADYQDAVYGREQKPRDLAEAWRLHLALSAHAKVKPTTRETALMRLANYSTKVEREIGKTWLEESFTQDVPRGIRLLSLFGSRTSQNFEQGMSNPQGRLEQLRMQNVAAEALVRVQPVKAREWQDTLSRLAEHWIKEAEISRLYTRDYGDQLVQRWDNFGNIYYVGNNEMQQQMGMNGNDRQPQPIAIRDLLEAKPSAQWMDSCDESLRPQFSIACAQILLKDRDEKEAFPFIEQVASTRPDVARNLVHDFLNVWTRNHDPNSLRTMYNPYIYIYGYNEQADTIPLTRSKQQRNLAELKDWISRIRQLPIKRIDETFLADAFTKCHSSAEVYRLESFEEVFGDLGRLKPETVARIADSMRDNLASVWRKVEVQEALKTKRKEADIRREVLRGYDVAINVVQQSQKTYAKNWRLQLALASLNFDRNAYEQSVKKSSDFAARRNQAFAMFAQAADLYRQTVPDLDKPKQESTVYDTWFYAALGASNLRFLSHENVAEPKQYPRIRDAILSLPPSAADYHLGEFANHLYRNMGSVQPQAKFRYVRGGLEIVGDHPRAREARRSLEYYTDVVSEIQLVTRLDGSDNVGHGKSFGVFVELRHTSEMERESGGFEKYVQNQNANVFMYNYGRPPENYRDKFEQVATQTLSDHFDVVSVTFENPQHMHSRPASQEGWRATPYAYIVLKAKGPQVDKLPPLQLNLDFLDSTGFVVIPIESAPLPLDCSGEMTEPRPMSNLELVQTLDERQAGEGKLILEVKATATGLIRDLKDLVELRFHGFDANIVDDQGSVPSEFDSKSDTVRVCADRSWVVELTANKSAPAKLNEFQFAKSKIAGTKNTFQRYDDADLVTVQQSLSLDHSFGRPRLPMAQIIAGLGLLATAAVGIALAWRMARTTKRFGPRYHIPRDVNPFTVLNLLDRMAHDQHLDSRAREELQGSIERVQRHFFAQTNGDPTVDLKQIVTGWVERLN